MHASALQWCETFASLRSGHAIDVGGRNVNGHARGFWPNMRWTVLDPAGDPGNRLDRVIKDDALTWVPDKFYDFVLCTEVLEHVKVWRSLVHKLAFMTSNYGGVLVITCAGPGRAPHSSVDGGPLRSGEYYGNVHPDELREALRTVGMIGEVRPVGPVRMEDVQAAAVWDRRF